MAWGPGRGPGAAAPPLPSTPWLHIMLRFLKIEPHQNTKRAEGTEDEIECVEAQSGHVSIPQTKKRFCDVLAEQQKITTRQIDHEYSSSAYGGDGAF